ncbi:MAG: S8 family serine peptidase, partial [Microcoleaceae cyanobacterium]
YAFYSGTSMATPHVAGIAALIKQANPSLSASEIEKIIVETANPNIQT